MVRIVTCWLPLVPSLLLAGTGTEPAPVKLQEGGKLLERAGRFGLDASSWSLRLPKPASSAHVIREDFILIREENRYRFISGGLPGSNTAAVLRTLPRQLSQANFKQVSADGGHLVFEAGSSREEIDIGALGHGNFRSTVTGRDTSAASISERLLTPPARFFWKPSRPPRYVGPGHGDRAAVIAAFSTPRANESIDEYEAFDCDLPLYYLRPNWIPIQTHVYEHTLRDRQGNTLVFFTARESGDVTYISEPEATTRGCEASLEHRRSNTPRSYDLNRKLRYEDEYVVRLELLEQGVPAEGVIVRLREWQMFAEQSCGDPGLGKGPDLGSEDGRTLADGSYAWKRERITHRTGGRIKLRTESVAATLCMRLDNRWIPIWHTLRERRGYHVRCDLAAPGLQRCRKLD